MKLRQAFVLFGFLILFYNRCSTVAQTSATSHKPIMPLSPAELLPFLPSTPAGWQLKESKAKNFFLGWVCSQASREFDQPVTSRPGSAPPPPKITRLRVMDTGYYPSFNGDFENFRVGKYPGAESLVIAGMPARKIRLNGTKERLRDWFQEDLLSRLKPKINPQTPAKCGSNFSIFEE